MNFFSSSEICSLVQFAFKKYRGGGAGERDYSGKPHRFYICPCNSNWDLTKN